MRITEKVCAIVNRDINEIISLRHHLHQNPEPSWEEFETTRKMAELVEQIGCTNIRVGFKGTKCGLTADLITDPGAPFVGLRCDLDALRMQEENHELSYRSKFGGLMHACGHDAHMAIQIGVARTLAELKPEIPGNVRFIFQPAEEYGLDGGGENMTKEGVTDGLGAMFGLHVWSDFPSGKIFWRNGPIMAGSDVWKAKITGKGGHGAMPHAAVDPVIASSIFINALQTIVSRECNPAVATVVTVGALHTGTRFNIIPETAELDGTCRTFDRQIQQDMPKVFARLAEGIGIAMRCSIDVDYRKSLDPVINDGALAEILRRSAVSALGEGNVVESPLVMASEDFSFFGEKIPICLCFLGCGNPAKGTDKPQHAIDYNVDDDALAAGIKTMALSAYNWLEQKSKQK